MQVHKSVLTKPPKILADSYSPAAGNLYKTASSVEDFLRVIKVAGLFFSLGAGLTGNRALDIVALGGKVIYTTGAVVVRIPKAANFLKNPRGKDRDTEVQRAFAVAGPVLFGAAALFSFLKLLGKFDVLKGMESFGNIGSCFCGTIGSGVAAAASFYMAASEKRNLKAMEAGKQEVEAQLVEKEGQLQGLWGSIERGNGASLGGWRAYQQEQQKVVELKGQLKSLEGAIKVCQWERKHAIVGGTKYAAMLVATLLSSFLIPRLRLNRITSTWVSFTLGAMAAGLGLGQSIYKWKKPKS